MKKKIIVLVLMVFILGLTGVAFATDPELTATYDSGYIGTATGTQSGQGATHFYVGTPTHDVLTGAWVGDQNDPDITLHGPHVGADSQTFNTETDTGGLTDPVVWHFIWTPAPVPQAQENLVLSHVAVNDPDDDNGTPPGNGNGDNGTPPSNGNGGGNGVFVGFDMPTFAPVIVPLSTTPIALPQTGGGSLLGILGFVFIITGGAGLLLKKTR